MHSACLAIGVFLSESQIERLYKLCGLLLQHNRQMNLTAVTIPLEVVHRHVIDSLTVLPALTACECGQSSSYSAAGQPDVVDVGTGAGFPGLPLAISCPRWNLTMIDSATKKVKFVQTVIDVLMVGNARAIAGRVEDVARSNHRDSFDLCVARAVAPIPILVEYCAPLVRSGGYLALYKSGDAALEVNAAGRAIDELCCTLDRVFHVPPRLRVGEDRFIVLVKKDEATPSKFPRRIGVARSGPLI